jgi:hypothetical protein
MTSDQNEARGKARNKTERGGPADASLRRQRLAQALRANLKRRKDQARSRLKPLSPSETG